jgi:hypothetical protein
MSEYINPRNSIELSIKYWWMIVLTTLTGGLVGWLISQNTPVIYESRVEITSSVDFTRTGTLTDIEQDQVIVPVGDVISSTPVLEAVVAKANEKGIKTDIATLREDSYTERQNSTWIMRVRSKDGGTAILLADIWVQTAVEALQSGLNHAVKAEQYKRYLDSLSGCVSQSTISEPSNGDCGINNLGTIQKELGYTGKLVDIETRQSLGLSTAVNISEHISSENRSTPVFNNSNTMVLSSAMLGFLVGIMAIQAGLPKSFLGNNKRA